STSISGNIGFEWLDEDDMVISNDENTDVNEPGIYTLIVTDTDNGCSVSTTIQVQEDVQQPIAEAGENQTFNCGDTELSLDGSGTEGQNLTFEWRDEDDEIISNIVTATAYSSGTFYLFVTNTQNGSVGLDSIEIIPDQNLPTADAGSAETLTCTLTEVTLDGSDSDTVQQFSYEWYNENDSLLGTDLQIPVSLPGTYTLIVLNADNNCQSQDEAIVLQNTQNPQADAGEGLILTCSQTLVTLAGTGSGGDDLSFEWFDEDEISIAISAETNISIPGTYTFVVTNDENGCSAFAETFVAIDTLPPTAVIAEADEITCVNESVLLDGTGSSEGQQFSYEWQDVDFAIIGTDLQLSVDLPGSYTFTVFNNENGCESQAEIVVFENTEQPTAVASADEEFDCVTESVVLSGTGSSIGSQFIYNWSGSGIIDNSTNLQPTVYEPGIFTLMVTNLENGCTDSASVQVLENENMPVAMDISSENPRCYGDFGSITILSVSGGETPY